MTTRQRNDQLYYRVVEGDRQAFEQMVDQNVPLVYLMVGDYLSRYHNLRHLREDLIAEGQLGVVKAVNNMIGNLVPNPNPTRLIRSHIFYAFEDVSHRETKLSTQELEDTPTPETSSELLDTLYHYCDLCGVPRALIDLKAEGYTDAEIAIRLGYDRSSITKYRKQIKKLYEANT